jgi:Protein of unknown function DUF262
MTKKSAVKSRPRAPVDGYEDNGEPVSDIDEASEIIPFRYAITSYGADYPVDGLVKRLNSHDVLIPTFDPESEPSGSLEGFQRRFVWTTSQSDKFIESLLLGLPVPGIFLVKQTDGRLLVLDGQQRLRTLQAFYSGLLRGGAYTLDKVQKQYEGLSYKTLDVEDRRRLDDSIIHATIVRQDEPSDDQSSIYLIFERLNTGGTSLQPQEIRVALYHGAFVKLLRKLNDHDSWRKLFGQKSSRLKDQELILRFFAMYHEGDRYQESMKEFLNKFTSKNSDLHYISEAKLRPLFHETCDVIYQSIGSRAFRLERVVNAAVLDSLMVGIARRLQSGGPIVSKDNLIEKYEQLIGDDEYLNAVVKSTADLANVQKRLKLAVRAFSKVR